MRIKTVKQKYYTVDGVKYSYAVWINHKPRYVFYSKEEYEAFRRGLNGRS